MSTRPFSDDAPTQYTTGLNVSGIAIDVGTVCETRNYGAVDWLFDIEEVVAGATDLIIGFSAVAADGETTRYPCQIYAPSGIAVPIPLSPLDIEVDLSTLPTTVRVAVSVSPFAVGHRLRFTRVGAGTIAITSRFVRRNYTGQSIAVKI